MIRVPYDMKTLETKNFSTRENTEGRRFCRSLRLHISVSSLVKIKSGFTLLETVLALAVFAIIVVPAIGLVALSYRNSETEGNAPNAVEIKTLLELELGGATILDVGAGPSGEDLTYDVFHTSFLDSDVVFYASSDLQELAQDGTDMTESEKYYKVTVAPPSDYTYDADDAYRVFLFNIIWPAYVEDSGGGYINNEGNAEGLQQLILPAVLRK